MELRKKKNRSCAARVRIIFHKFSRLMKLFVIVVLAFLGYAKPLCDALQIDMLGCYTEPNIMMWQTHKPIWPLMTVIDSKTILNLKTSCLHLSVPSPWRSSQQHFSLPVQPRVVTVCFKRDQISSSFRNIIRFSGNICKNTHVSESRIITRILMC